MSKLSTTILVTLSFVCSGALAVRGNEQTTATNNIPAVETISSGSVQIESARVTRAGADLFVSGTVRRVFGSAYPAPRQSHLDVDVVSAEGRTVSSSAAHYLPRVIPADYRGHIGRSTYTERLSSALPAGATVRVSHHEAAMADCRLGKQHVEVR